VRYTAYHNLVGIMIKIHEYISKHEQHRDKEAPTEDRFVAYANGIPALMIEFFPIDFHIYGPRAPSLKEFFGNLRSAAEEIVGVSHWLHSEWLGGAFGATMVYCTNEGPVLKRGLLRPSRSLGTLTISRILLPRRHRMSVSR
jgi:hypothetical protein